MNVVKESEAFKKDNKENVDRSLSTIDRGLDEAVEITVSNLLEKNNAFCK